MHIIFIHINYSIFSYASVNYFPLTIFHFNITKKIYIHKVEHSYIYFSL